MAATMVCERCRRHQAWGILSGMAWLEHKDGDGASRHVCPDCSGELTEEERRAFRADGTVTPASP